MAKSLQLKCAIWVYMILNSGALAYAAEQNALVAGLESIPAAAVAYVLGLAAVGGAAGTLTKIARPDLVVRHLALEIAKDIVASLVAGLLVFFFTSWIDDFNFWLQAALVTLAGYGGSKVLDIALVDGAMPWLRDFLRRVFNIQTPPKDGTPP